MDRESMKNYEDSDGRIDREGESCYNEIGSLFFVPKGGRLC